VIFSLSSFSNRTSSSDNSNDHWKRFCLFSWALAPCVCTLRALTRNLLTYLLIYLFTFVSSRKIHWWLNCDIDLKSKSVRWCYYTVGAFVGDSIVSCGVWSHIQTGFERTSVSCLLPFQQPASWLWPRCKCIILLYSHVSDILNDALTWHYFFHSGFITPNMVVQLLALSSSSSLLILSSDCLLFSEHGRLLDLIPFWAVLSMLSCWVETTIVGDQIQLCDAINSDLSFY